MINKKIATSFISIAAALMIAGGATFAFFSDTATSSGNVFAAGNLNMQLSNDNTTFTENVTATLNATGMAPGTTFSGDLFVNNAGSVPANHIDIGFTNNITEGAAPGDVTTPSFASVLEITVLDWDSNGDGNVDLSVLPANCDNVLNGGNGNGICDLQDLEGQSASANQDVVNLLFTGTQSSGHKLHMEGRLSPTLATNANQGDSNDLTIGVFMDQGPH